MIAPWLVGRDLGRSSQDGRWRLRRSTDRDTWSSRQRQSHREDARRWNARVRAPRASTRASRVRVLRPWPAGWARRGRLAMQRDAAASQGAARGTERYATTRRENRPTRPRSSERAPPAGVPRSGESGSCPSGSIRQGGRVLTVVTTFAPRASTSRLAHAGRAGPMGPRVSSAVTHWVRCAAACTASSQLASCVRSCRARRTEASISTRLIDTLSTLIPNGTPRVRQKAISSVAVTSACS